jgi:hypothetical protein
MRQLLETGDAKKADPDLELPAQRHLHVCRGGLWTLDPHDNRSLSLKATWCVVLCHGSSGEPTQCPYLTLLVQDRVAPAVPCVSQLFHH